MRSGIGVVEVISKGSFTVLITSVFLSAPLNLGLMSDWVSTFDYVIKIIQAGQYKSLTVRLIGNDHFLIAAALEVLSCMCSTPILIDNRRIVPFDKFSFKFSME